MKERTNKRTNERVTNDYLYVEKRKLKKSSEIKNNEKRQKTNERTNHRRVKYIYTGIHRKKTEREIRF